MKIFIDCECELMQASLENFLSGFIANKYEADFIVCDSLLLSDKPIFIIGSDICIPFTSTQLKIKLNEFAQKHIANAQIFEKKLDEILLNFKTDLIRLFSNAR